MHLSTTAIAELEWGNYAATLPSAQLTPGLDVELRDDVILTSSAIFPTPDANHAALLRATPQTVEALLTEITAHYTGQGMPSTIYLSAACTPGDLPERLTARGFIKGEPAEAWMVLELTDLEIPTLAPKIPIRQITPAEVNTFAEVFLRAFEMPLEFAPAMGQLLKPSVGLPGIHHYLAYHKEEPVGTLSLLCYQTLGILGSAGVLTRRRGTRTIRNLVIQAAQDARRAGVDKLLLQTAAGTLLERFLRICGFQRAFVRECYTL